MSEQEHIHELVGRFGKAYQGFLHSQMSEAGSTPARTRLLATLSCFGTMKMAEIGERLGVTARNVTKLVDALEDEGLLERMAHPTDRRVTLIALTCDGVMAAKAGVMRLEKAKEFFECLSQRDKNDMRRVLLRLLDELESQGFGGAANET